MAGEPALSDYLPIPHATAPLTADPEQQREETAQSLADAPTMSHALAVDDHDVKGEAQLSHNGEIKDLGWTDDVDQIVNPLVGGMPNQDLWVLIRRFNKVSWPVEAFGRVSRSSCHDSKCIMSRNTRIPCPEVWISTLQTRRNSPPISFEPILNVCT